MRDKRLTSGLVAVALLAGLAGVGRELTAAVPTLRNVRVNSPVNEGGSTAANLWLTEFTVPTAGSYPNGIAAGPDGAVWFTEFAGNRIGRITTNGAFTEYPLPARGSPALITPGPDGALWFTEWDSNRVGRISASGVISEFPVSPNSNPAGIVTGHDDALWFTEYRSNRIGRITTNGVLTEFPLPAARAPYGITTGPDRALWFAERNYIGKITTNGVLTEFVSNGGPIQIVTGPAGALWFSDFNTHSIKRITTSGVIADYPLPPETQPLGITTGPDGAIYYTAIRSFASSDPRHKAGRMTNLGSIQELGLDPGSRPSEIVTGPDGALWFTESDSNRIARLVRITNGTAVVTGQIADAQPAVALSLAADWGDGSIRETNRLAAGTNAFRVTHYYADNTPKGTRAGNYTVRLTLIEPDGGSSQVETGVTVANVPPMFTGVRVTSLVANGDPATLTATFIDAGGRDHLTLVVNWGDGSPLETYALAAGSSAVQLTHPYLDAKPFLLSLELSDDDGGSDSFSTNLDVCLRSPPGLVSWWPGDGHARDVIGGNHGQLSNGVSFVTGEDDRAFRFSGSSSFVTVPASPALNLRTAMTLQAWVNPSSLISASGLPVIAGQPTGYQVNLLSDGRARFSFPVTGSGTRRILDSAQFVVSPGFFNHIIASYDSLIGEARIQVNGSWVNTLMTTGLIDNVNQPFQIGGFSDPAFTGGFFNGAIDEVEIYNRALSPTETMALYGARHCKPPLQLSIAPGGDNIVLTWPAWATAPDFLLQATVVATPPFTWSPATGTPVLTGAGHRLTNSATGDRKFYRLIGP